MSSTGALNVAGTKAGPLIEIGAIFSDISPNTGVDSEVATPEYYPPNLTVWNISAQRPSLDIGGLLDYLCTSGKKLIEQEKVRFNRNLLHAFELEPIEDGHPHPAERIIKDALKTYNLEAFDWIKSTYLKNITRSAIAAGILRCLGRLSSELTSIWGVVMAASGLLHPDIESREAAVRALEAWGGKESLEMLKAYVDMENVPWLKDYIKQVIIDLSE